MSRIIELSDLAVVPERDRHLIAAWLTQMADRIYPSFVLTADAAHVSRQFLYGAAADLASPDSDGNSVSEANEIIARLRQSLHEEEL